MKPRSRILALSFAALMVTTSVVTLIPAATAQDSVATKPGVLFTPVPGVEQQFFLRFPLQNEGAPGESNQPDCQSADRRLALDPATGDINAGVLGDARDTCRFADGTDLEFRSVATLRPYRDVTITGNRTIFYTHAGTVPANTILNVTLASGGNSFARGTLTGTGASTYTVELVLQGESARVGRAVIARNQDVVVRIESEGPAPALGLPTGLPRWDLDDVATYVSITADNGIRAATWVTDETSALRTIFTPIPAGSTNAADANRRIVGHFALESAFGYADASRGDAPRFRVFHNNVPRELIAGGGVVLEGVLNASASAPSNGTAVWSFPAGTYRYTGAPSGAYSLRVEKDHHRGSGITAGVERAFAITAQTIELAPYADTRFGVSESQAHTVIPGSSTTYVLAVNNTGAVNDTFTIRQTAANPPPGWGASIAGPDVQGSRIFVPAGETRVFTLTVNAPLGATGQIIHLVNVTSTLDPSVRSRDITLVTTIGNETNREIGILFLARNLTLEPDAESEFPVYVWNRGTRPTNLSLELRETRVTGWNLGLVSGGVDVSRLVVGNVQPGDIAPATLRVVGARDAANSHAVTFNVTNQDVSGISLERTVTFDLRVTSGVTIQVLDSIGGQGHVAETEVAAGGAVPGLPNTGCSGDACNPDGIEGLWYRLWITNNGRATETFTLSDGDDFTSNCGGGPVVFAEDEQARGFFARNADGLRTGVPSVAIPAGRTAEVYYLLDVNQAAAPCGGSETLTWVIQATGTSGAIARQQLDAVATNSGGVEAVLIEPVSRRVENGVTLVDTANLSRTSISGAIRPGNETFYYVRITNAASWRNWTDDNGATWQATDLRLTIGGVDRTAGWNVSMRPVRTDMSLTTNPYERELNLSNLDPSTDNIAWIDREVEIRVQAPSAANGTAVTNARDEIFLTAEMNNSATRSTLEIVTVVSDYAEVKLNPVPRVFAHAGDPSSFLLYLENVGGSETPVTVRASFQGAPAGWNVEPNARTFSLAAFKNRTQAVTVTPPAGAAAGTTATVLVNFTYAEFPKLSLNQSAGRTVSVPIEVVAPGTLTLTAPSTTATVAPGQFANFTMTLRNTGGVRVPFRLNASDIPNWTVTASPEFGNLTGGETRTVTLVARVPTDVTNESRFSSIVRVEDLTDASTRAQNFDTLSFEISILGGRALPAISVPNLVKRVDRGGAQSFEVGIRNVGSAAGVIPLEVRSTDPNWPVTIKDAANRTISSITLAPNELQNVYLNVSAPFTVPENTVVPVEIAAYTPDLTQRVSATLSAEIHDYGVQLTLSPSSKDGLPGVATEFTAKLRNTGNDNDTLNLSVNLVDFAGWNAEHVREVRLEPNQETEVRITLRSPDSPLPTPRSYTFPVWVGTRGGQSVNIAKNMTQSAVVAIPNYRSYDVDGDTELEVAVDLDRRAGNGFEEFREVFTDGVATRVVGKPVFDTRTTFLLDVPETGAATPDGLADIWFNPETVYAYRIVEAPDVNGDGTPDYFLDTDRDGEIDRAYDSVTERFWTVTEVKVFGDERIQYLVDTSGDGRPDRFYDPETDKVTRTQTSDDLGADFVGIDVDDDETVDYYYNTRTEDVSGAEIQNIGGFAAKYWYFFVAFAALILVSILLIVRRRRQ